MTITHLYVDRPIANRSITRNFIQRFGHSPEIIDDTGDFFKQIKSARDPWHTAKQAILLTQNKGAFLKECPGTKAYNCCGYQILHLGSYCSMDCSYCILQSYFHPPILQYFVNQDDMMHELDQALAAPVIRRIGTGEFSDSLIWEQWSDATRHLIHRFSVQSRAVLELKTKTTAIGQLKGLDHHHKTIMSWSLNTPHVIATQERGTASLASRLRAAAQCHSWGYPLAFHFDPMIVYPGCEMAYRDVITMLFDHIPPDAVVWISLGTFRFMPALKQVVEQRFPDSDIVYGEFIPGLDGKMRYFKPLRIRLYRSMVQWIKELAPQVTTYLCMEDDQVWEQSFGYIPQSRGGLAAMLDASAINHCGLCQ